MCLKDVGVVLAPVVVLLPVLGPLIVEIDVALNGLVVSLDVVVSGLLLTLNSLFAFQPNETELNSLI